MISQADKNMIVDYLDSKKCFVKKATISADLRSQLSKSKIKFGLRDLRREKKIKYASRRWGIIYK